MLSNNNNEIVAQAGDDQVEERKVEEECKGQDLILKSQAASADQAANLLQIEQESSLTTDASSAQSNMGTSKLTVSKTQSAANSDEETSTSEKSVKQEEAQTVLSLWIATDNQPHHVSTIYTFKSSRRI